MIRLPKITIYRMNEDCKKLCAKMPKHNPEWFTVHFIIQKRVAPGAWRFFLWLKTPCKISDPYDNSFWEKINDRREREREEKNAVDSGHLVPWQRTQPAWVKTHQERMHRPNSKAKARKLSKKLSIISSGNILAP
jgi:hypothetical protein